MHVVKRLGLIMNYFLVSWKTFLSTCCCTSPPVVAGHSTHSDLMSMKFAKNHTCLPPNITHKCQPLDCSLFQPLKDHWRQECRFYCKNSHQQAKFQQYILKCMVLCLQMPSGIRKTGVYLLTDIPYHEWVLMLLLIAKEVRMQLQEVSPL